MKKGRNGYGWVAALAALLQSSPALAQAKDAIQLRGAPKAPAMTYIVHGEPDSAEALRDRVSRELCWRAHVAVAGEQVLVP